jgi:hypothetical protein
VTHRGRLPALLLAAAAAALMGGCATNATRYEPSLSSVDVPLGDSGTSVTALVSVGPVPAGRGMPETIEMRLRLDNHGERPVALEAEGLELVAADLTSLGRPELIPAGRVEVAPGGAATVGAAFAVPPELKPNPDALRALNLRFELEVEGRSYASSVTFDRVERERSRVYGPYEYGYWPYPGFVTPPIIVVHHQHKA